MARQCRISNKKLEELRIEIKEFAENEQIIPGTKQYSETLDLIRLKYTGLGGSISAAEFNKVLKEYQIDISNLSEQIKPKTLQLQVKSLSYKNIADIYRNATSALGYMKHTFSSKMFKCLFVDNTNYGTAVNKQGKLLNDTVLRIPLQKRDINIKIAEMKEELIQLIVSYFNIQISDQIFKYAGTKSVVDIETYKNIFNDEKLKRFVSEVNSSLDIASQEQLKIHSAIFILNNFDELVSEYLNKIVTISPTNKNSVENFEYVKEFEGNAPSIWSVDDLVTYGSDLYASNLGKFILGTINKVDLNGNPIEGAYMTSQDSFVIASLLREAETEYHILKRPGYNPQLSIKTDLKTAVKTLMRMGLNDELKSLEKFKRYIQPLYNWLYVDTDKTLGIQGIQQRLLKSGNVQNITSILNLEDVILSEITKNVAPVYLEYNTQEAQTVRTIYAAHIFRGTNYIADNLKAMLLTELDVDFNDRNELLKGHINRDYIRNKSLQELLTDNSNTSKAFLDLFELLFNTKLSQQLIDNIPVSNINALNYIKDIVFDICDLFINISTLSEEEREIELNKRFNEKYLNNSNKDEKSDLANKYILITQTIADLKTDLPITVIRSHEGKAIPIYRLNSTIFEDTYLLSQFKVGRVNRNKLNFFVDNLHLLSNINNPRVIAGEQISVNKAYQGSTGLRLETISSSTVNAANDASAQEAYINTTLGDFLGLGSNPNGHSISVQLMTLSDKASIIPKIINLDAIVYYGNQPLTSLDNMSNQDIEDLYYFYRKNQVTDEIFHIIETWKKLLNLDIEIPDINVELNNFREMLPETSKFIKESWQKIKDVLHERKLNKASQLEFVLREYNKLHSNEPLNLVKDLHYRTYDKQLALNKNIYYHYKQVRSKSNFAAQLDKYVQSNIESSWFTVLTEKAKDPKRLELIKKYCGNHTKKTYTEIDANGKKVIKGEFIPFNAEFPIDKDLIRRRLLLENFLRSQLLELHFKGPQLDAIKGIPNYDEELDTDNWGEKEADKAFKAAGKRTVDLPGTKQNFAQNLIDGVSSEVLVAHINEPTGSVFNPLGQEDEIEILNGSGRISYIYAMMESASMCGSPFKGINRKTLGQHVDDFYSTLYKWAEYLINNWHMRNSSRSVYQLEQLFRKMHNVVFDKDIDLTKSFLRPNHLYTPRIANNNEDVFFARGLHFYKLIDLIKIPNTSNTYNIIIKEVDKYGQELIDGSYPENLIQTQNIKIDNLYSLFNVLGGVESMSKNTEGILEYSDVSLRMLYNYVINIGQVRTGHEQTEKYDQTSVYQPLRNKFISIAASTSGIKRGETNTNHEDVYTDQTKDLLTSKIRTALFGAQMDVYHHIDDESTATEPTQTLAALATNGNTREEANRVYTAISDIIHNNMRSIVQTQNIEYNKENAKEVIAALTKDIMKTINEGGTDLQRSVIDLCKKYLDNIVPISDSLFYNAFHTYNIRDLNQLALRRKYSGLGGVLNPSCNSYQLFRIGNQDLEYDDLVKRGRMLFSEYIDALSDLNTRQIANLYLYSKTTIGNEHFKKLFNSLKEDPNQAKYVHDTVLEIVNIIENNLYTPENIVDETLVSVCGVKIHKGEIDPLDTVFYKKDGQWHKIILDTCSKYFNFIMDTTIEEVQLDITTPHDLKPQIMKYTYEGIKHSLYDSEGGQLSYLLNSLNNDILNEMLQDLDKDGDDIIDKCDLL